MAIVDSELQFFKSITVDDTANNGGRMGNTLITTNVQQNVFPHVFKAQRDSGLTTFRKIFPKVSDPEGSELSGAKVWLDNQTPGADWIVAFLGTDTDTQAGIASNTAKVGVGNLTADVNAGATTIEVEVEDATLATGDDALFKSGQVIMITDKATPDASSGNIEEHTLASNASVSGTTLTLTITGTLANSYETVNNARVSGVLELGDLVANTDNYVVTSASGTFADGVSPVLGNNVGSVRDTITLTFTTATSYDVAGTSLGALGSGTITADYSPDNTPFSQPYFTIQFAAFGGSFATGDTVVFELHPASHGIWEKRVVPVNCPSLASDTCTIVFTGESA